jgi:uncharacterized integral membrane protein
MRAVGNFYSSTCIVQPSDAERMNSALPTLYLKMFCFRDVLTAVRKLFVASNWSGIKTLNQLKLPELHLVALAIHSRVHT